MRLSSTIRACVAVSLLTAFVSSAVDPTTTSVPGVHEPLPINSTVDVPDSLWLLLTYRTLLDRPADEVGYRTNFGLLQRGEYTRQSLFFALVASAEFQSNSQLSNASSYVSRAYEWWLRRPASPSEVSSWASKMTSPTKETPTTSQPVTWYTLQSDVFGSAEYHENAEICPKGYYTLGNRVDNTSLLLADLFDGNARMSEMNESEQLSLTMPSAVAVWDQKMPVWQNPDCWLSEGDAACRRHFAVTRSYRGNNVFTLALLESDDAVNFNETGVLFIDQPAGGVGSTFYDAHIAVDYTVCPPRYVATMECMGHGGAASVCVSFTTTPTVYFSWTQPIVLVDGCVAGRPSACKSQAAMSGSTGVSLIDGSNKYVAWTQVYDGLGPSDPLHHTYSQMTGPVASLTSGYLGVVDAPMAKTMLPSVAHPWCTSAWDCNNRDKQDWKREGGWYYATYNGARFYRCDGRWGISATRSPTPTADGDEYYAAERLPLSVGIEAVVNNTCGIGYPVVNVIEGELWVYYTAVDAANVHVMKRGTLRRRP